MRNYDLPFTRLLTSVSKRNFYYILYGKTEMLEIGEGKKLLLNAQSP